MFSFEAIIGIEVHVALNTATKMFSSSANCHDSEPNTNINVIDLGLPGTLPQPNKGAIQKALILAKALNMKDIDHLVRFDRKNYFYQDLPKGFQITQQYHPFAQDGYLEVVVDNEIKQFKIQRFHLEEDTAKQFSNNNSLLLDYNRAGAPLIEIVTDPIFRSAKEVKAYLTSLRQILLHNNISDAKMEAGSLRADVNLSIRPMGSNQFGTRVEIKNVNSINNIEKAIQYEIASQVQRLLAGEEIVQATLRYDDVNEKTVFMREKGNDIDYRYMREPNIIQIRLDNNWVNQVYEENVVVNPVQIARELKDLNIEQAHIDLLLDNLYLFKAFNYVNNKVNNHKETIRWLVVELGGILNKQAKTFEKNVNEFDLDNIVCLIKLLQEEKINGKQAKKLNEVAYESKKSPEILMKELGMEQIVDPEKLRSLLVVIIKKNQAKIDRDYQTRADRVESMILGLLMKETNAQANPVVATKVLRELLNEKTKA